MIKVKMRGASCLQGVATSLENELPLDRQKMWFGRGEEILEKENEQNYVLNLGDLSQSVSRLHACLIFSPAFRSNELIVPSFFKKLKDGWGELPNHLHRLVWQFARPAKKAVLRDWHSKTGIFRKVEKSRIKQGMEVIMGDTRPIIFQHQQIYDGVNEMVDRVRHLQSLGFRVLNEHSLNFARSFWIISFKQLHLILLNHTSKINIGRSSSCQFVISQASVSRKHAYLEWNGKFWYLYDGDGSKQSSNGVWERQKRIEINCQNGIGSLTVKIADVLVAFQIKQNLNSFNLLELSLIQKQSNNQSINSILRKELEITKPDFQ